MLIKTYNNQTIEFELPAVFAKRNLLALPGIIDPHVHFRTPGAEHKEDWITGSAAAIAGGVTTVIDMPNNNPPTIDYKSLMAKKKIINQQIKSTNQPVNYLLYLGATPNNWIEFEKCKNEIIGIKLFMGASTGNLLVDKKADQEKIFAEAARLNLIIAVHAEDEQIIQQQKQKFPSPVISDHSKIRSRQAAIKAVTQAIELAKKYQTKLYICHVSTQDEIELIKTAKSQGLKIFAEVAPHHLFLNQSAYQFLGTKAQMNPPLRLPEDQNSLWQAIKDNIIDAIGTDHAPHTIEEKSKLYPNSPSGVPGVETSLPLLLNAYNAGKITLEKIVELTHVNPQKIFNLPDNNDWVIVDLDLKKEMKNENLKTKCGWSPFDGQNLQGWPVATILNNKIYLI